MICGESDQRFHCRFLLARAFCVGFENTSETRKTKQSRRSRGLPCPLWLVNDSCKPGRMVACIAREPPFSCSRWVDGAGGFLSLRSSDQHARKTILFLVPIQILNDGRFFSTEQVKFVTEQNHLGTETLFCKNLWKWTVLLNQGKMAQRPIRFKARSKRSKRGRQNRPWQQMKPTFPI